MMDGAMTPKDTMQRYFDTYARDFDAFEAQRPTLGA
jgi:hypothetical protein